MARYLEIDFVRGFAVMLMVFFNYSFALRFLGVYDVNLGPLYWTFAPVIIAGLFLILVGVSATISYNRVNKTRTAKEIYLKFILRGLKLFCLGLGITVVTWLTFPRVFVVFGILHLIGVSVILSMPFLRARVPRLSLAFGVLLIAAGIYLHSLTFDMPWLLWLGFTPTNFQTLDYFPIIPWFGLVLIGIYFGGLFYNGRKRLKRETGSFEPKTSRFLCFLGRNSLLIYLLHQPVLMLFLTMIGVKVFP